MSDHLVRSAKSLRRRMTPAEHDLWRRLRAGRFAGIKFKRQQPLGPYIVDFVCFSARVVIEIDGGQHLGSDADRVRDQWLVEEGFRVLRFWNSDVWHNLDGVLECIHAAVRAVRSHPLSPAPSPARGEGRNKSRPIWKG